MELQQRAERLAAEGTPSGGPVAHFERVGRHQFATLIEHGLRPDSKVLDIGCGALRGGYWMIHFLRAGGYHGIEPNKEMLQAGLDNILEPGLAKAKKPRFDHNDIFDFSVFAEKFDMFIARSIWTHASKGQIEAMLDGFAAHGTDDAVFLASYLPANWRHRDYKGDAWVGRSHRSKEGGVVRHSTAWLKQACTQRGLRAQQLPDPVLHQHWLRIERA